MNSRTQIPVPFTIDATVTFLSSLTNCPKDVTSCVCANKHGYTTSQSEAVWLTHKRLFNHCSFVPLRTTNSRHTLHLGSAIPINLAVFAIWFSPSLIVSLCHKTHQTHQVFCRSQSVSADCCSVFLAVCVNVQQRGQSGRCALSSPCFALLHLTDSRADALDSSTLPSAWSCDQELTFMLTNTVRTHNRRWIFHS